VPGCPGVGPRSYQLVRNGVDSGGTAAAPLGVRPSEMIFARTLMRGMERETGTDRGMGVTRDALPVPGVARGPAASRAPDSASDAGGSGGGDQRSVLLLRKGTNMPAAIATAMSASSSLRLVLIRTGRGG
jgi:hypothetical protein